MRINFLRNILALDMVRVEGRKQKLVLLIIRVRAWKSPTTYPNVKRRERGNLSRLWDEPKNQFMA